MIRSLNSANPILDLSRTYTQNGYFKFKPIGLWYEIDGSWVDWCKYNQKDWLRKYVIEIEFDLEKVLILKAKKDLNKFIKTYEEREFKGYNQINWRRVAEDYSGIEIQNYNELKWNHSDLYFEVWFLSWDISSGCIWDLSIIKKWSLKELIIS